MVDYLFDFLALSLVLWELACSLVWLRFFPVDELKFGGLILP